MKSFLTCSNEIGVLDFAEKSKSCAFAARILVYTKRNKMNSIKQYRTVSTPLRDELDSIINDLLGEGFQPHGSPYALTQDHSQVFCQAMVSFSAKVKDRAALDPKLNPRSDSS